MISMIKILRQEIVLNLKELILQKLKIKIIDELKLIIQNITLIDLMIHKKQSYLLKK